MEEIFVFGILILLIVVGVPLYLLIALNRLKSRVSSLEAAQTNPESKEPLPVQAAKKTAKRPSGSKPASAWQPAPKVKPKRKSFVFIPNSLQNPKVLV